MTNFAPVLAAIATAGLCLGAWYAVREHDSRPLALVMVANSWIAFLAMLGRFEATGHFAYGVAALGVAGIGAVYLRSVIGRASERRIWRQLFGETFLQLIRNDPRRHRPQ